MHTDMTPETDLLTPGEMAEACDVTVDTLRYYENTLDGKGART